MNLPFRQFLPLGAVLAALFLGAARASAQPPAAQAVKLLEKNDLAAAEALLTPLTGTEGKDAAAFFQLGQLRLRQQRTGDAIAAYEKATALDPAQPEYFSAYGSALSGKMPDANFITRAILGPKMQKAFERAFALDPNHLGGLIGLARCYLNAPEMFGGSLAKATEFAERVRKLQPHLGESELGRIAERREDYAAALAHYEVVDRLMPDQIGTIFACGRVLAKLGKKAEARARFEAVLRLKPDLEPAKKALAALAATKD